jgi:hypothetical protein
MAQLILSADTDTENLVGFITGELDNTVLDSLEVSRDLERAPDLAREPVTVAVTLTLSTVQVVVIARLIERWLAQRHELKVLKIVAEGFQQSSEAGKAMAEVAKKYSAVAVSYGLPRIPPTEA